MKLFFLILTSLLFLSNYTFSQNPDIKWKRSDDPIKQEIHHFHSTHVINLPTSESLQKGNLEFEISHRFIPSVKSGGKELLGFDGPVNIRLALGYALTDNALITLGRSNLNDNYDLKLKQKLYSSNLFLPVTTSLQIGSAYSTQAFNLTGNDINELQYYFQLIINSNLGKNLALGVIPSYLYNSYIFIDDKKYSLTLGTTFQYYLSSLFSFMFEWNPTITGFRMKHNPVSFGIELETGGHFFKIILSNSTELNLSQFLAGTRNSFNDTDWHIGFNITRLLNL